MWEKTQVNYIEGSKMRQINLLMLMGAIFNIVQLESTQTKINHFYNSFNKEVKKIKKLIKIKIPKFVLKKNNNHYNFGQPALFKGGISIGMC